MVKTLFKPEMYISAGHAEKPPHPMGISFVLVDIIEMHIGKGTVPSVRREVGWEPSATPTARRFHANHHHPGENHALGSHA